MVSQTMDLLAPLVTLLRKIPFRGYFSRAMHFMFHPDIRREALDKSDLRFALIDTIFSLGVVSAIFYLVKFIFPDLVPLDLITAINPVYVIIPIVTYALIFCLLFIGSYTLINKAVARGRTTSSWLDTYYVFLHCMRAYSLAILLIGLYGLFSLEKIIQYLYVFKVPHSPYFPLLVGATYILTAILIFWLLIIPITNFMPIAAKGIRLSRTLTTFIFIFSILPVFYPSWALSRKVVVQDKFSEIMQKVVTEDVKATGF